MKLEYSKKAHKHLASLPSAIAEKILDKIDWFVMQDDPLAFAIPLVGNDQKLYRFRIGDYRAIFMIKDGTPTVIMVIAVKHRREAYR